MTSAAEVKVSRETFGYLQDGKQTQVDQFTLQNKNGMQVQILSYGATIRSIKVPDQSGDIQDVVLGFDDINGYLSDKNPYFGAVVGRVANRIANGQFHLDGKTYTLAQNNGTNSLHGGIKGFDKVVWNASVGQDSVTFTYLSADGEEGYPGALVVNATYRLTVDNALELAFLATTTEATPLNLANHAYFNLAGHAAGAGGLEQHWVNFNADNYLPTSETTQIPIGHLQPVGGSVFDLRIFQQLGTLLPSCPGGPDFNGYDHNFCVNDTFVNSQGHHDMRFVCRLEHRGCGRALECYTNQPGCQLYTGNFIPKDDSLKGKESVCYKKHAGFCLETQAFPDAVNQSGFPHDSILRPGQLYDHRVTYKFFTC